MTPGRPSFGRFTRKGRLVNRWEEALAEPDPVRSSRLLLDVCAEFGKHPGRLAALWPPFLGSVLNSPAARLFTAAELTVFETTGAAVAGASAGEVSLETAWFPLIAARHARREYDAANALLGRLYWSADLAPARKAVIARELARRGASTAEHQAVYVDHLATAAHPSTEPRMVAVLTRCLAVGFDLSAGQVAQAGELAGKLRAAGVPVPGVDLALGYAALLVGRDPARAAPHLEAAHAADRTDLTALLGLLSAWVRGGQYQRVLSLAREPGRPAWRVIDQLALLSATLHWLEDSTVDGLAPASAAQLAALPVATYAGEWLGYAIGRLHLLEGDASAAAAGLVPLAEAHPEQPRWNYHAAWALLLLGDWPGVAQRFLAGRNWPGRWTIGCLLAEANPNVVDTVERELAESGLPPERARIVEARLALGRRGRPGPAGVLASGDGIPEERLESLRTALGISFSRHDMGAMNEAIGDPAVRRLPLADQLLWSGLALPPQRGHALLEQAAEGLRYPRAGLVLAVRGFQTGSPAGPDRLAPSAWRADPTMELVRAWAEVLDGTQDVAAARLEALAEREVPAAHYALGNLWLQRAGEGDRAALARAAEEFRAELRHESPVFFNDARILVRCAELTIDPEVSTADCAGHWAEIRDRAAPGWVGWTVALAALAEDPAAVDLRACEYLVTIIENAEPAPAAAVTTVASGLARACLLATEADRAATLAALLGRLAGSAPGPEIRRLHELSAAAAARHRPAHAVPGVPGALVMAEHSLAAGDRPAAAGHLRAVPPGDTLEARFCQLAADLLADRPVSADLEPPAETSVAGQAFRVLQAAAVVNDDPDRALDLLGPAIQHRDLTGIVDLRGALPRLCAGTGRRRQVPEFVARMVRAARVTGDGAMDPPVLARCLAAIGERQRALALWRQLLADHPEVREEYTAALCHEAVVARRQGEDLRAAECLLRADRVIAGGPLSPTHGELVAPATPSRLGIRPLVRKRNALDAQAVLARAYAAAVAGGDEPRALLCLALLGKPAEPAARAGTDLAGMARSIVSELCLGRLLDHLYPDDRAMRERPGRHKVIESFLERNPNLLFALLDGDRDAVAPQWRNCLITYGTWIQFHHALAVLYRERALASADDVSTVDNLVVATTLWALLLSTERFWQHLGGPAEEAQLRESVARELLTTHETRGRQALAAGELELAGRHLRCLADCRADAARLLDVLDTVHIRYRHPVDEARFAEVAAIAADVMRNWVADVVRVAQAAVDDKEAIEKLPDGVHKNYPGGIEALRPFVRLDVPVPQVLITGLEWFNDWRFNLLTLQRFDQAEELTEPAGAFADPLVPLCVKNNGLQPENQVLSDHHLCVGLASEDPAVGIDHLKEAIAWNPGNGIARKRLSSRLTEQAVGMLAKETPFVTAMEEIDTLVQRQLKYNLPLKPVSSARSAKACAVCGDDGNRARLAVVESIVRTVRLKGEFRATRAAFWNPYVDQLCDSCRSDLAAIPRLKPVALGLLDEAVSHDSTNDTARKLLEIVRPAP